jgi:hypothetical protein
MGETPNDSGDSPASVEVDEPVTEDPVLVAPVEAEVVSEPANSWRSVDWKEQIRRPAVWGLLLLIGVVLLAQIWLLFL